MANPLYNEDKIYEKIKKENIKVDPIIWELLNHHIRNDLNLISILISILRLYPPSILKSANSVINLLYRIKFKSKKSIDLIDMCDKILERIESIDKFLRKLQDATYKK